MSPNDQCQYAHEEQESEAIAEEVPRSTRAGHGPSDGDALSVSPAALEAPAEIDEGLHAARAVVGLLVVVLVEVVRVQQAPAIPALIISYS